MLSDHDCTVFIPLAHLQRNAVDPGRDRDFNTLQSMSFDLIYSD